MAVWGRPRWLMKLTSREPNATRGPMPDDWLDAFLEALDPGTRRTVLRLYRATPEERLAAADAHLDRITCPARVVWPSEDPHVPTEFGPAYAKTLGGEVTFEMLEHAGHWFWLDRPDVIDRIRDFVT
jgi:pimeloyl-ACP methyl ester carboxylesterase